MPLPPALQSEVFTIALSLESGCTHTQRKNKALHLDHTNSGSLYFTFRDAGADDKAIFASRWRGARFIRTCSVLHLKRCRPHIAGNWIGSTFPG